jgi:hypothetical protein
VVEHDLIELWDDNRIDGGNEWREEIDRALERCDICILLVSRYSLSSRFILDVEMKCILERHRETGRISIPSSSRPRTLIALPDCAGSI